MVIEPPRPLPAQLESHPMGMSSYITVKSVVIAPNDIKSGTNTVPQLNNNSHTDNRTRAIKYTLVSFKPTKFIE